MTKIGQQLVNCAKIAFLYIFHIYSLKIFAVGGLGATAPIAILATLLLMTRLTPLIYASAAARWRGCVYVLQRFFCFFPPSR